MKTNKEIKEICNRYVALSDEYKNAYFMHIDKSYIRRLKEKQDYLKEEFNFDNDFIVLNFSLNISARNVYVSKEVLVNNETKDLRFVKKILKRLDLKKNRKEKLERLYLIYQ